jgi:hypothetical protein
MDDEPVLPEQNVDINFSAALSPHSGQTMAEISAVEEKTSSSNL